MSARVFFSHTVAAMFVQAFPVAQFPGLEARYRAVGLDLSTKLLPAYSYEIWRACLEAQREVVFPGEPLDRASHQQGAKYVAAYFDGTVIGAPLKGLLRLIGPRRALDRMSRNFKTANNFSEVSLTARGENEGDLLVNDVFSASPHYIVGMLEHGLGLCGMHVTVSPAERSGDACSFRCAWR